MVTAGHGEDIHLDAVAWKSNYFVLILLWMHICFCCLIFYLFISLLRADVQPASGYQR